MIFTKMHGLGNDYVWRYKLRQWHPMPLENMYMITDLPERKLSVSRKIHLHIGWESLRCYGRYGCSKTERTQHSILSDLVINDPIEVQEKNYRMTGISMGNPHAVIFSEEINGISLEETGREDRMEGSVCEVGWRSVWEGVGETLACGTGACAKQLWLLC